MTVQKQPEQQKRRGRPPLRKRDKKLIERSEVACGLDVIRPGQRLVPGGGKHGIEADEAGNVVLLGAEGDLVPFAQAEFVGLYPEGHGKRLRFVVLRPYFDDGEIHVGGSRHKSERPAPDDGHQGLWKLPGGRVVFRGAIPDDYTGREYPDGHYKDLRVTSGKNALSLFSFHPQYKAVNKHLRRLLTGALKQIEHVTTKSNALEAPSAFVAKGAEFLNARFLQGNFSDVVSVTELLADIMNAGFWALPGLENVMVAQMAGVVKDVGESHISVEWADGSGSLVHSPKKEIVDYIRSRVPVRTANLTVVPLVREGEKIDAGTVLWGGSTEQFITAEKLRCKIPENVNEEQQLQLLRVWALLAVGSLREGQEIYPMKFVAPRKAADVYFVPGVSRVALTQHPAATMCAEARGISVDFYTLSHRSRHWRRWRERVEREEAAAAHARTTAVEEAEVEETESAPE